MKGRVHDSGLLLSARIINRPTFCTVKKLTILELSPVFAVVVVVVVAAVVVVVVVVIIVVLVVVLDAIAAVVVVIVVVHVSPIVANLAFGSRNGKKLKFCSICLGLVKETGYSHLAEPVGVEHRGEAKPA